MNTLLIATHNAAKLTELIDSAAGLKQRGYHIVSLNELHIDTEPDETGNTFRENALLKAKYYAQISQLPTIADDGGLMIDYLHGEPGVHSRRWPGYEASDEELIAMTLQKLDGIPDTQRTATLTTCLCYFDPNTQKTIWSQEKISGYIGQHPSKKYVHGYPYRSLFIVSDLHLYYDELTMQQHAAFNHRKIAMRKLIDLIVLHHRNI